MPEKGRVVLVGTWASTFRRRDFYYKELDFLVSTSYGPGRYDRNYEERGLDYPAAYVRWTENRNITSTSTSSRGEGPRQPAHRRPAADRPGGGGLRGPGGGGIFPPMLLLEYPRDESSPPPARTVMPGGAGPGPGPDPGGTHRRRSVREDDPPAEPPIPGGPLLPGRRRELRRPQRRRDGRAVGARYSTTDHRAVLDDPEIDAVVIAPAATSMPP